MSGSGIVAGSGSSTQGNRLAANQVKQVAIRDGKRIAVNGGYASGKAQHSDALKGTDSSAPHV